jgi:hypothetical protein
MLPKQEHPENYPYESIKNIPILATYTNIKIPKEDHGRIFFCTSIMGITYSIPSIFQTFSPCYLKERTSTSGILILARLKQTNKNNNYKRN